MDSEKVIREHVLNLLKGGIAYAPLSEIIVDFPEKQMNTLFPNGTYSAWDLLEHIRMTQFDILDFMKNPNYKEPEWPKDYWPNPTKKATKSDWDKTVSSVKKDLQTLQEMVQDPKIDLYANVPQGSGQTFLREFILTADHNSYHLGEFSIMRQVMGSWPEKHKK